MYSNMRLKADLLAAFDLFHQIVSETDLNCLIDVVCNQVREITGARYAAIININADSCFVSINPSRKKIFFSSNTLKVFCEFENGKLNVVDSNSSNDDLSSNADFKEELILNRIENFLVYKLDISEQSSGSLVLFNMPRPDRVEDARDILSVLSTPIALSVRKALDNELILQQRCELEKLNEELKVKASQAEEKYRFIFENSIDGIIATNKDISRFVMANPEMCRMLGYSEAELLSLKPGELYPVETHSDGVEAFKQLREKGKKETVEVPVKCKDGSILFCALRAFIMHLDGEDVYVGFFSDITQQKKQEEEMQRADRLESLGILAGGIAHDFNNLMGGIFGYIELASLCEMEPMARENLEVAMNTIDRARSLTGQLLTFSKGGSPAMKVENLKSFLEEMVPFSLSGSNVCVEFDIAEDLKDCLFDRNQMSQVIDNIVINARQAMIEGGVIHVSAKNTDKLKESQNMPEGNYVMISIKDNGPGIDSSDLNKVFDPFYTTKEMGQGLGLAVCHSIIRKHNGDFRVNSKPGQGCELVITLPASENIEPSVSEAAEKISNEHSGLILILEDEEVLKKTIVAMLNSLGYECITGEYGEKLIGWLKEHPERFPDVKAMIMDLTIRDGKGGVQTLKEIREMNISQPAFVVSGYADDPVMASPDEYGFAGSLSKPFTLDELSNMLTKV